METITYKQKSLTDKYAGEFKINYDPFLHISRYASNIFVQIIKSVLFYFKNFLIKRIKIHKFAFV